MLTRGRARLESLKLEIYWQVGRLLARYLRDPNKSVLGEAELTRRLSRDLNLDDSALYRTLQFARAYPEGSAGVRSLTWSHMKELLTVPDETKRKTLALQIAKKDWSVRRLRLQIQKERGPKLKKTAVHLSPLEEPPRFMPGIRRIKALDEFNASRRLVVDLGFDLYEDFKSQGAQIPREGATVKWNPARNKWLPAGSQEELYYYHVRTERVVDGDTLLVHIRASERITRRQYLRLRGINAEELTTANGRKAKRLLETEITKAPELLIRTHLTDRYDRYIADVWTGGLYLNNELLRAGLAVRAY